MNIRLSTNIGRSRTDGEIPDTSKVFCLQAFSGCYSRLNKQQAASHPGDRVIVMLLGFNAFRVFIDL